MVRDVQYVTPNMTVDEVIDKLLHSNFHGFPVVENGYLLGYVTAKELLRFTDTPRAKLRSVMSRGTLCAIPSMSIDDAPARIVALDGVQDPGNVGTIWRTADAAGFSGLLLGPGCADPLSPKVQRAAMGSGFRVPYMLADDLPAALMALKARGWTALASDLNGADFYRRPDPGARFVLVIGNEARGISAATREAASALVKLPMRGGAESLNAAVAAGIMMYELMRE